ncbi:Alpha-centractin [Hypsibius exemplaris]|uniref:Alpha-centractin n=1 Tax=Hypsibius exemplaris TaxID=2072580 RepID=A0A1W0WLS5_HYPEX|nr:Alpha-centractin [Hypsibius exemplaris]
MELQAPPTCAQPRAPPTPAQPQAKFLGNTPTMIVSGSIWKRFFFLRWSESGEMETTDVLTNVPVVIDNGSGLIKAGFAGDQVPKSHFPNFVGRTKYTRLMAGGLEGDIFVGPRADEHRGLLSLKYPMEHGIVTDWSDMERVWRYVYSKEQLHTDPEEHPVLLTEPPNNPRRNREKMAEIFFETFNVPAAYISLQAVLSLYSTGRTTGLVLDCGDGVTHAVPIFNGFAIQHCIQRTDIGGRDVTNWMRWLLMKEGHTFHTTSEFEVVRQIKERMCYLALDPDKEELKDKDATGSYQLPDGTIIDIGPSRFRAPELLFQPHLFGSEWSGIHEVLHTAIRKSDLDLRKSLYSNIILSGGSTLIRGFGDRLLQEIKVLAPKDNKVRIAAPQERMYSIWIGGSILASLETFRRMWISKKEYQAEGMRVVHRKTF